MPYGINIDADAPYKTAINELKKEGVIDHQTQHSQRKFLNNIIESAHAMIKQRIRPHA